MKLGIHGNGWLERLGLLSGQVPTPLIYSTLGMGYARSIVAATKLEIFEAISQGKTEPKDIATYCQCDPSGVQALCSALTGFGILTSKEGHYFNTKPVQKWILRTSRFSLVDAVLFMGWCHDQIVDLEEKIKHGNIVRVHDQEHPHEFWEMYMGALATFARLLGKEVVQRFTFNKPKRLLDVGGGHGLYSAALCQRYPSLSAEILDLPGACAAGRKIIKQENMNDRIAFREGDFRSTEWGENYDIILLFNVLHNATEEECKMIMKKSKDALIPGGSLLICDAKHVGQHSHIDAMAGWNELFFYMISGAQAWPESMIKQWMIDEGFLNLKRKQFMIAPQIAILGNSQSL